MVDLLHRPGQCVEESKSGGGVCGLSMWLIGRGGRVGRKGCYAATAGGRSGVATSSPAGGDLSITMLPHIH